MDPWTYINISPTGDKNVDESDNFVVHMVAPVGLHFLLPFGDKETFLGSILVFNIHSTN